MPVSIPIIDTVLHPPFGALENHFDLNSPYGPGSHTLTTWQDGASPVPVSLTYGVMAIVNGSLPPELGFVYGWDGSPGPIFDGDIYEHRMLQIVTQHQFLFGFGGWVNTQIINQFQPAAVWRWEESLPGRLGLYVSPGLSFDLQFLVAP